MAQLHLLPIELLQRIVLTIDTDDFLNLGTSSSRLYLLRQDRVLWETKISDIRPSVNLSNLSLNQLIELCRKLTCGGYLSTWGDADEGKLGLGNSWTGIICPQQCYPMPVNMTNTIIQVSMGDNHTGYVTESGQLFMCGSGSRGQLGTGKKYEILENETIPIPVPGVSHAIQVSCGGGFTAVITTEGRLYTFGNNIKGQLGHSGTKACYSPILVKDLVNRNIIQISCGIEHMAAVDDEGNAYVWGCGNRGALGNGSEDDLHLPESNNFISNIKQIACGYAHTLFLTKTGEVYSCGFGIYGQLGLGDDHDRNIPTKIPDLPPIKQVSAGSHSVFLSTTNEVYVCGKNDLGQLGLGHRNEIFRPVRVSNLPKIIQISCGHWYTAMISKSGEIYIYGCNLSSQLGINSSDIYILQPTRIPNISGALQISCGSDSTALITRNMLQNRDLDS